MRSLHSLRSVGMTKRRALVGMTKRRARGRDDKTGTDTPLPSLRDTFPQGGRQESYGRVAYAAHDTPKGRQGKGSAPRSPFSSEILHSTFYIQNEILRRFAPQDDKREGQAAPREPKDDRKERRAPFFTLLHAGKISHSASRRAAMLLQVNRRALCCAAPRIPCR